MYPTICEHRRGSKLSLDLWSPETPQHMPCPESDPPPPLRPRLQTNFEAFPGAATGNEKGSEYKYKSFRISTYLFGYLSISRFHLDLSLLSSHSPLVPFAFVSSQL
jgi:hypothetical protein